MTLCASKHGLLLICCWSFCFTCSRIWLNCWHVSNYRYRIFQTFYMWKREWGHHSRRSETCRRLVWTSHQLTTGFTPSRVTFSLSFLQYVQCCLDMWNGYECGKCEPLYIFRMGVSKVLEYLKLMLSNLAWFNFWRHASFAKLSSFVHWYMYILLGNSFWTVIDRW